MVNTSYYVDANGNIDRNIDTNEKQTALASLIQKCVDKRTLDRANITTESLATAIKSYLPEVDMNLLYKSRGIINDITNTDTTDI